MSSIVLITDLEPDTEQQWLLKLKQELPQEDVLLAHQLSNLEAAKVDIAVVANPEPSELLRFPNLVWIQSLWAGVENLLADESLRQMKLVRLIDPELATTMAESVLAWTLYLQRQMPQYAKQQQNRQWNQLPNVMSRDLRVAILGAGKLGLASIEMLQKLEYKVYCWSRTIKEIDGVECFSGQDGLAQVLKQADIVVNLLPHTAHTHKLLDFEKLSQLPAGAQLINFSRGAVLDHNALIELLDNEHLSHAVLDVFEQEPLEPDSPLWQHPKITVLPHISAPTSLDSAVKIVAQNIIQYRTNGILLTLVDSKTGY